MSRGARSQATPTRWGVVRFKYEDFQGEIVAKASATLRGGWDTHDDQGGGGGATLAQGARLAELSGGIRAFYTDLGPQMSNVVLVTCTEFGRTVRQNASGGTDHGKASVWFVLGGGVKGGLYHGAAGFPSSLVDANLDSGRYIRPTIEFRDLFSDVLVGHFGVNTTELNNVFPGYVHVPVGVFV